ncbi:hypothetical protein EBB59_10825 [Lysobacter pythonis]|uniref:YdbS-like PH domain-containing protein n=1 Tax=Solilutibacter pythonis TaxID=2483112 RepID=A0A3M2HH97_9GAMM|nr:PH domain-containing protein [Lysobacter pythonis]RMH89081.1 hypothetical protein EBB59_10825 [Lysobacter pythonis]
MPPPIPPLRIDGEEHRLHPWSWLFVTLQHLKQFVIPLLFLLLAGRGNRNELWPLIGVGVLAAISVWQYFTYRYRLLDERIEIRSGLLERKLRQIAYARIHNVALHQTLLHRIFAVAEVRLESAGGNKPEAEMRVLRMDKALALEKLVRERGGESIASSEPRAGSEARVLLAMDTGEVIRHGLISNRGLVLVAAGFAAVSQVSSDLFASLGERFIRSGVGYVEGRHFGWLDYLLAGLSFFVLFVVVLRVLSVAVSLMQYHGFTLSETGRRLTVSRGLFTRIRTSAPKRRIQAWLLKEGVLHRLFGRRELSVDTAVSASGQHQQRGLRELAPVASPARCDEIVRHLLPRVEWPLEDWRPLHRLAWLRMWLSDWLWTPPLAAALIWHFGDWGWLALLWLPWSAFLSWKAARCTGWRLHGGLIAVRHGWWSRQWRFAEVDKLQALQLTRSPLDRLFGMRGLLLDTAGANALAPLHIAHLRPEDAEALRATLAKRLAKSALRW